VTAPASRVRFLGLPLDPLDMDGTVAAIAEHVEAGRPGAHLGVNAANLVAARDDEAYRADLEQADLVTADGQSVVWGARLYGIHVPERVTGIDLMERLLGTARERNWGVYLLGARADTVARLASTLAADGVRIAGFRDGYFGARERSAAAAAVQSSGATLLFVGMPSPQKERFIIGHARPAGVPFSIGVGGSFDVLAGELRRAPRAMQRTGLEWLFRLLQEPGRLFGRYAVTNTRFLMLLVAGAVRRRPRGIGPWI
jgi:N-acetylglucosaminyldiphosphoundecaprenol N-acetyl-beta-D-mannosaminyltransferase